MKTDAQVPHDVTAELAAKRVDGVRGIANEICVREARGRLDDPEIARRAIEVIDVVTNRLAIRSPITAGDA